MSNEETPQVLEDAPEAPSEPISYPGPTTRRKPFGSGLVTGAQVPAESIEVEGKATIDEPATEPTADAPGGQHEDDAGGTALAS